MINVELNALKKRLFQDNSVKNIKFFPGTDHDASPEDIARDINKYFAEAEGDGNSMDLDVHDDLDN